MIFLLNIAFYPIFHSQSLCIFMADKPGQLFKVESFSLKLKLACLNFVNLEIKVLNTFISQISPNPPSCPNSAICCLQIPPFQRATPGVSSQLKPFYAILTFNVIVVFTMDQVSINSLPEMVSGPEAITLRKCLPKPTA